MTSDAAYLTSVSGLVTGGDTSMVARLYMNSNGNFSRLPLVLVLLKD
jgi:hypothetical protein